MQQHCSGSSTPEPYTWPTGPQYKYITRLDCIVLAVYCLGVKLPLLLTVCLHFGIFCMAIYLHHYNTHNTSLSAWMSRATCCDVLTTISFLQPHHNVHFGNIANRSQVYSNHQGNLKVLDSIPHDRLTRDVDDSNTLDLHIMLRCIYGTKLWCVCRAQPTANQMQVLMGTHWATSYFCQLSLYYLTCWAECCASHPLLVLTANCKDKFIFSLLRVYTMQSLLL